MKNISTSRPTSNDHPRSTHEKAPITPLKRKEGRLLRRVVAGKASSREKDKASRLIGSNLAARDRFFELLLTP
ncbi:MAG: hypothetical protein AAF591_01695 [Verrucomicrobiota bacterium]